MKRLLMACALLVAGTATSFADGTCEQTVLDATKDMVSKSSDNGFAVDIIANLHDEGMKPLVDLLHQFGKPVDGDSMVVSEAIRKADGEKHHGAIVIVGKGGCYVGSFMLPRDMVEKAVGAEG